MADAIDIVMEAASGPHFSGLRLDGRRSMSSSPPSTSPLHNHSTHSDPATQPFVIGVSGGTASGKTTVCDMIIQQLHDHRVVLVNQDSFYRGLTAEEAKHVHEYNFDHPDAFDTEQLLECVEKLRCGQCVQIPIYDFKKHRRSTDSFRQVNASDVIILEGILVFHDQRVRDLMNMKIFVDTDADVRLARRIRRDTVERGRDINSVLEQYAKFVKPAFDDFVLPSKKYADVIIPRGGDNHVAVDLIVQHIHTKLGQHDICKIYPNVTVIHSTFQIRGMHTLIRDREISKHDFVFYSDRLIRLVVEHGLGHLPFTEKQIVTPTGIVKDLVMTWRIGKEERKKWNVQYLNLIYLLPLSICIHSGLGPPTFLVLYYCYFRIEQIEEPKRRKRSYSYGPRVGKKQSEDIFTCTK